MIAERVAEYVETRVREGKKEGRREGKREGRREEKIKTAQGMLDEGFDIKLISRITGLSEEEIKNL